MKLTNDVDYMVWKSRVFGVLRSKDLESVITSETIDNSAKGRKNEGIAKNIIQCNISNMLYPVYVEEGQTARELIQKLDNHFLRKSLEMIFKLKEQLNTLRYKLPLKNMFDEYQTLLNRLSAADGPLTESDKIYMLFLKMPAIYRPTIEALKCNESLTLQKAMDRLLAREAEMEQEQRNEPKVLYAQNFRNPQSFHRDHKKYGHKNYPKKTFNRNYSAPKNTLPKKQFNRRHPGMKRCYNCGSQIHLSRQCPKRVRRSVNVLARDEFPEHYVYMLTASGNRNGFVIDSGASDHIINNPAWTTQFSDLANPIRIYTAKNSQYVTATMEGQLKLETGTGRALQLQGVYFVPEMTVNVLSVSRLMEQGLSVLFAPHGITILCQDGTEIRGEKIGQTNYLFAKVSLNSHVYLTNQEYILWHNRLGHLSNGKFETLRNKQMFSDSGLIKNGKLNKNFICEPCNFGKMSRLPLSKQKNKDHINRVLQVVHSDVWGPARVPGNLNEKYFVTFIDAFTHYCVLYLISHKSDVYDCFIKYTKASHARHNFKISQLYCDNGGEYISNEMKSFCNNNGIELHYNAPYTSPQNGIAERYNRTVLEQFFLGRCGFNGSLFNQSYTHSSSSQRDPL